MAYAGSGRRRAASLALAIEILLAGLALGAGLARRDPLGADYVHIEDVAARPSDLGTGSYTWDCGRNEIGHRNTANVVVTPGRAGPSHHVHDYIGNLSVDVGSTVRSLAGEAPPAGTATSPVTTGRCCAPSAPTARNTGARCRCPFR
nr:hypothetical protein GCM10020092_103490 [Actinoplanes digitatis]